jgi:hypothetical protein
MEPATPMVRLTTVSGSFQARVLAARLDGEGVLVEVRGASDGAYPIFCEVGVYVRADQEALAREILLGDEVDAVFDELVLEVMGNESLDDRQDDRTGDIEDPDLGDLDDGDRGASGGLGERRLGRWRPATAWLTWIVIALLLLLAIVGSVGTSVHH